MIVLFTDFGASDLYVGQVKAVFDRHARGVTVIDALHEAPAFGIAPAAHLLCALSEQFPAWSTFLAVVDPGVGGRRDAIVVEARGQRFVGPDNGLLSVVWNRRRPRRCWRVKWRPSHLSDSFHGRDLFARVAAALATHVLRIPRGWLVHKRAPDVLLPAGELPEIIYVDHYGNAMTGLNSFDTSWRLRVGSRVLSHARTFEAARRPFWYANSMGLVEIAAPKASAARLLRLKIGSKVSWED